MKKLLLLGGSTQQLIAIKTARNLGYCTVLCDYLPDNPGQYEADKFYLISTTDREAVLKVAIEERIDGVLAYASDPAAPTAAYICEKLRLPTNPLKSVETLCNKDLFREFLKKRGFNAPISKSFKKKDEAYTCLSEFQLPVIVKPVDSSGSKGTTILESWKKLGEAIDYAFSFSKAHRVIMEEFIGKSHKYIIGGDIFVYKGEIILWGLLNCHRDSFVNPLVPMGKSYPLRLDQSNIVLVKSVLQNLVKALGIQFGSMNVELIIDNNNRVWPIDIGPRAGGNMIPDLLSMIFQVNVVEMAVLTAMGEPLRNFPKKPSGFYATHNLHSTRNGIYKDIIFHKEIAEYIKRVTLYKNKGDLINRFDNAANCLGIVFMEFPNSDVQNRVLNSINKYIEVKLIGD